MNLVISTEGFNHSHPSLNFLSMYWSSWSSSDPNVIICFVDDEVYYSASSSTGYTSSRNVATKFNPQSSPSGNPKKINLNTAFENLYPSATGSFHLEAQDVNGNVYASCTVTYDSGILVPSVSSFSAKDTNTTVTSVTHDDTGLVLPLSNAYIMFYVTINRVKLGQIKVNGTLFSNGINVSQFVSGTLEGLDTHEIEISITDADGNTSTFDYILPKYCYYTALQLDGEAHYAAPENTNVNVKVHTAFTPNSANNYVLWNTGGNAFQNNISLTYTYDLPIPGGISGSGTVYSGTLTGSGIRTDTFNIIEPYTNTETSGYITMLLSDTFNTTTETYNSPWTPVPLFYFTGTGVYGSLPLKLHTSWNNNFTSALYLNGKTFAQYIHDVKAGG